MPCSCKLDFARSFLLAAMLLTLASCGGGSGGGQASTIVNDNDVPSAKSSSPWKLDQSSGLLKLHSPGHNADQSFGQAVAVGDFNNDGKPDLAVGAPLADSGTTITNAANTGGVYLYYSVHKKAGISGIADVFLNSQTDLNSQYGAAVLAQDVNNDGIDDLLVGAPYDDRLGATTGGVYFYYGSKNGLSQTPDVVLDHPLLQLNASFGSSLHRIDLDGDFRPELLVGADRDDTTGTDRGAIWIFQGQPDFSYSTAAAVRLSDNGAGSTSTANSDFCGAGIWVHDFNGDTFKDIYMGCPRDDSAGADRGAFRIFLGTGISGSWVNSTTTADLEFSNPSATKNSDYFGQTLHMQDINNDGNEDLLVGSYAADVFGTDSGGVYVYNNFNSASSDLDARFGPPYFYIAVQQQFAHGITGGDVNRDGKQDLIFGSSRGQQVPFGFFSGRVDFLYGSSTGINLAQTDKTIRYDYHLSPTVQRNASASNFGSSLCQMDFNGDGLQDVVVGAIHDDTRYIDAGAVSIYYGRANGKILGNPDVRLLPEGDLNAVPEYGSACLGMDINADGFEDLLVGAWQNDDAAANSGSVWVYLGSARGVALHTSFNFSGPGTANYGFGKSLARGDIDNDGFDDLIVGASLADVGGTDRGALYVFRSDSVTGVIDTVTYTRLQHTAGGTDNLGTSVLSFDYDGDGDQDLLAGAPEDNDNGNDEGRVYVWINGTNGSSEGVDTLLDATHDFTIDEPAGTNNVYFGSALASSTYSNHDFPDLFVGAERYDSIGRDVGAVYIYEGSASGFLPVPTAVLGLDSPALDADEQLGSAIMVTDFNTDGIEDLIIGASADDTPGTNAGSVYIKLYK